uniref:Thioredoxin domain-containing protein n=1 Tax=Aureoumbra lagunensis TaxID=44058 RepID=A0A6S8BNA8_9STRA
MNIGQVPMIFGHSSESSTNPYTGKPNREMKVFAELFKTGIFKPSDLKRWVSTTLLPKDLVKRGSEVISSSPLPTVALITERSTTSALTKSLAVAMRDRLQIVELSPGEAETFADADDELPKLVALSKDSTEIETYGGSLKSRNEILTWLESKALSEAISQTDTANDKDQSQKDDIEDSGSVYGSTYVAPSVTTAAELGNLWSRSALLLAPVNAKPVPTDVSRLLAGLDGSGLVRAASCDVEFTDHCDAKYWRAFATGGTLLLKTESSKEALDAVVDSISVNDVIILGDGPASTEEFMQRAIEPAIAKGTLQANDDENVPPAMGILIFSNSEQPSVHVRALATTLRASLDVSVGQYVLSSNAQDAQVLERFGISKAPAIIAFHGQQAEDGPRGQVQLGLAPYDRRQFGPPTFRSLITFSQVLLQQLKPSAAEKLANFVIEEATGFLNSRKSSDKSMRKAKNGELVDLNSVGLDAIGCGEADGASQLCAIFLLDQIGRSETFVAELAIAKDVALAEATAPYSFGWFDGQCHLDLALAFDIDPMKLPTVVAYAPKKKRFAAYVGRFDAKDLKSFLRGVVSGRLTTAPIRSALPSIETSKDCTATTGNTDADATLVEDTEELDDFMAEILAEEAARKEQLEAEANAELERIAEERRLEAEQAKLEAQQQSTIKKKSSKKKKKKSKKTSSDL